MLNHLLILFNPYYQENVIEAHLEVLKNKDKVAFGKVKSKINDGIHPFMSNLESIYKSTNEGNTLYLYLTDYVSLYVAKVSQVLESCEDSIKPSYYKEKDLEVEQWFIIDDLRELVFNDFKTLRDNYLVNFTTPNYANNATYAIYGNSYIYPLIIKPKVENIYFEENERHYTNLFKSKEFLEIKNHLELYVLSKSLINLLHMDSIEGLVSSEIEYQANSTNPLYDYSSIIIKYSKIIEKELHLIAQSFFKILAKKDSKILDLNYQIQGKNRTLRDIFTQKPNLGSFKYLIAHREVQDIVEKYFVNEKLLKALKFEVTNIVYAIQEVRNKSVHEESATLSDTQTLREKMLGMRGKGILVSLAEIKEGLKKFRI